MYPNIANEFKRIQSNPLQQKPRKKVSQRENKSTLICWISNIEENEKSDLETKKATSLLVINQTVITKIYVQLLIKTKCYDNWQQESWNRRLTHKYMASYQMPCPGHIHWKCLEKQRLQLTDCVLATQKFPIPT